MCLLPLLCIVAPFIRESESQSLPVSICSSSQQQHVCETTAFVSPISHLLSKFFCCLRAVRLKSNDDRSDLDAILGPSTLSLPKINASCCVSAGRPGVAVPVES